MLALACILEVRVSLDFLPRNALQLDAELFDFVLDLLEISMLDVRVTQFHRFCRPSALMRG